MIFQKGLVLRKSGEKTFKVLIQKRVLHKKYKKILTRFKKILIDDRFNCCRPG
ncbi:ribosomal protein S17 [Candidatus Pinguicoccus supinus]|uniref:Ribosomal protein S17 n=1 Tax=Candidatus Pinguicoccus supinus TaxID=2529394 RepID=A0A7T0BRV5_9BACT|nr:ribosomal protein S17 [Candidatus Pinguicoccus supinus]